MEKQHDIDQNRILTILTAFSTFLMGFIDAYTFIIRDGVFASAQTGNMVVLVAKLFGGHFWEAMIHVSAFIGFALGAFFGQAIIEHFKEHDWKKYRIYLLIQAIFLLFIALIQQHIGPSLIGFLLGLLAGYELTIFRKIKSTNMNNGIMTGNTKNLMNNLYLAIFNKDSEALQTFYTLLSGIGIFMLGVGAGTLVLYFGAIWNLWCAFLITGLFYLWLLFKRS
ncbi:YoaK family protein [Lederbergia galactosidilytica]|uniref:YoaK family protein n=1 Tax=Lederbergia galactosidilytica TaxID=217031 RepID=UPI000716FEA3|nr:YoaK family protein [Lederbergia galactosidilytica]